MKRAWGVVVGACCALSVVACGGKVLGDGGGGGDDDDDVVTHPTNQADGGGTDAQTSDAAKPDDPAVAALREKEGEIAYVYFQPMSSIPDNVPPSHNVLLDDPKGAQDIYDHTVALPRPPAGAVSCPADFGIYYDLQFFAADNSLVEEVQVDAGGCNSVTFVDTDVILRADGNPYFLTLASDLGLDEKDIYPYAPDSAR